MAEQATILVNEQVIINQEQINADNGGVLMIADVPEVTTGQKKLFRAGQSGTYTNAGGLVVDLNGKIVDLYYDGTTWSKVEAAMPDLQLSTVLNPNSTDKAETGKSISSAYPKEYQSNNLFDKTFFVDNKFFLYTDVNYTYTQIAADANGWFISDEIPVTVGIDYFSKNASFGFFDANDKMIAAFPISNTEPKTAPSGAVYARLTAQKTNLDSIYFAKEKKQDFSYSSLKIESGQKTISEKILPPSALSRKGNNLIVSVRGGGDFRWINDAIDWLKNSGENDVYNPFTFEIIDGVYDESVNMIGLYLSLIGRNRENCIIKTYTNDYYNPPIDMAGNNHLQNLTIIADDDGTTTPVNGVNNMPAYGIHFDVASRYENLGWKVQGRSVVKNCRVIAKHQHAVGQGLWTNQYSEWDDCEFISYKNAAFRSHNYLPAGATNQQLFVRNCRFSNPRWNAGTEANPEMVNWAIMLQDANLAGGNENTDTVFTFQNNVAWCDGDTNPQTGLLYRHTPTQAGNVAGKIKLGGGSFGNNIPELNF